MPNFYGAFYNLGIAFKKLNRLEDAVNSYKKVLSIKPEYPEAYNNLGTVLKELGRIEPAIENYIKATLIKPNYAEAHNNLGVLYKDIGNIDKAIDNFEKATQINPNFYEGYCNLGIAQIDKDQISLAIKNLKKSITINSSFSEAFNNLGVAYMRLGQDDEAIKYYNQALNIDSNNAEAHNNFGLVLMGLGQINTASEHFIKALELKPEYIFALNNFGLLLKQIGKYKDSLSYYERAIAKNPDFFEAHNNLGNSLKYLKRHDESLAAYLSAYSLNPNADYILGNVIHSKLHLSIWKDLTSNIKVISKKIKNKEKAITPFPLMVLIDNPELQKIAAEIYVKEKYPQKNDLAKIKKYDANQKIKVGYFSADFRIHPVANLTAELYEIHDRTKFEVHAFSFGPETNDEMNIRIRSGVDFFHDIRTMSHKDAVIFARSLKLDIAIDLGGFTQDSRTGIFAMRAAPIQVSYLGYSGTMGADFIDYIIADKTLIPENLKKFYTEKIVYMPNSFMVNDTKNNLSKRKFSKKEVGLPEKGFIFSCFNHHYKINSKIFKSWMRILSAVDGSVLWLSDGNKTGKNNLKKEAEKHNIDYKRLIFAPRLEMREDHLKRIQLADLFLDTLPYNAHATTSDALQVGLPVLTCIGKSFASRVAASLINSVNLPELITSSLMEYEDEAIALATNSKKFINLKNKLDANLSSSPLYNTPLYVKQLELSYLSMYERYNNDRRPDDIIIENLI